MELNIYEILNLDENETNLSIIKKQFETKKKEWSKWKNQGTPKQQELAKTYTSQLKEIEEIVNNSSLLKTHQIEYQKKQKEKKQKYFQELEDMISLFSSNEVSEEEYNILIKHFKNKLTENEINKELKKFGITKKSNNNSKKPKSKKKKETLENSKFNDINTLLEFVKAKDLYDFLGVSKNSSLSLILQKADELYKKIQGKTDTENSRKSKLIGYIKDIFKDEQGRKKYNNSLSSLNLKVLEAPLKAAGANKVLDDVKIKNLLKIAKRNNINEDDAIEYIEDIAQKRKWVIVNQTNINSVKLLECGFCGEIADNERQVVCNKCGENLIQLCPNCNNPTPTQDLVCSKCGFKTGDRKEVQTLLKEAKTLIVKEDYKNAKIVLNKILTIWPNWTEALNELDKINNIEKEYRNTLNNISNLIKQRKFFEADALSKKHNINNFKKDIENALNQSKSFIKQAQTTPDNIKKIELYEKALSVVSDCNIAIIELKKVPLPAPKNIKYYIKGDTLKIEWDKNNFNYLVIKNTSIPQNSKDGVKVSDTSNNIITDKLDNKPHYYAIFPKRNVIYEKATILGPFFRLDEVKNLNYNITPTQISMKWENPDNCMDVEVYKTEGNIAKKVKKITTQKTSFIDNDIKIDKTYTYLIIAKYKINNKIYETDGIKQTLTPTSLPQQIKNLKFEIKDDVVYLKWEKIKDQVILKQFDTRPSIAEGEVLSISEINKIGKEISIKTSTSAQLNTLSSTYYFVIFSVKQQIGIVGNIIKVSSLKDVSDVKTIPLATKISITFTPPSGAKDFWVVYRYDRFANSPKESGNIIQKFTIREFNKEKKVDITIQKEAIHYITIYTYDKEEDSFSKGVEVTENGGEEVVVKYYLKKSKQFLFFGKITSVDLILEANKDVFLEDVAVVFKERVVPLNINSGIVIKNMKKIKFNNKKAIISISQKYINENGYIKLFFKKENKVVRLLPAKEELIKL